MLRGRQLTNPLRLPQRYDRLSQLYLIWCHNQPLPLFQQNGFKEALEARDYELYLAIQAWCSRFPPESHVPEKQQELDDMAKSSRQIVMSCIAGGNVKLSTLQTLCILSLLSFAGASWRDHHLN